MDIWINFFLLTLLSLCAVTDIRTNKIYNILTLPFTVIAVALHSLGNGMNGFIFSTVGIAAGVGLLIFPYLMRGLGGGDLKLMGAIGSFLGAKATLDAFMLIALAGGVYSLGLILVRQDVFGGFFSETMMMLSGTGVKKHHSSIESVSLGQKPRLKYGVAIAFGTITYLLLKSFGIKFFA